MNGGKSNNFEMRGSAKLAFLRGSTLLSGKSTYLMLRNFSNISVLSEMEGRGLDPLDKCYFMSAMCHGTDGCLLCSLVRYSYCNLAEESKKIMSISCKIQCNDTVAYLLNLHNVIYCK